MPMKVDIISKDFIKPTSPTPDHLRTFKICLLDELAPPSYVPILLLYSPDDFGSECDYTSDFNALSNYLKKSLSKTLTRFYPFAGKLRANVSVDCNDEGALYVEAKADIAISEIVKNPETSLLHQLLPFDPFKVRSEEEAVITGIQLNLFSCGGVGFGMCFSHKLTDGATMISFLNAWAATATGVDETLVPRLDASSFFPPKGLDLVKQGDIIRNEKVVTKRFEFNAKNLANLKAKVENGTSTSISPTRVEAVTALIWKSAVEAVKVNSGNDVLPSSAVTHLVNIRGKMQSPLPEHTVGNICRLALAPCADAKQEVKLDELTGLLRKAVRKIDAEFVAQLQGPDGLMKALEAFGELRRLAAGGKGGFEVYTFSSWTRFPLYDIDFGWGKPMKACTLTFPIRNFALLMGTRSGDGIEALVTLSEKDMAEFERNQELLQFVSASA